MRSFRVPGYTATLVFHIPRMSPVRPRLMTLTNTVLVLLLGSLALYAGALGWLWLRQEKLLFAPTVLRADQVLAMAPDVHEVAIDVPGARLSALHLRLPHPKGVVFFLHGNGGSLSNWFVNPEYYRRVNFDLFMIDYRGYGKSTGQIGSEAELRADVRAAWASIAAQYADSKVVIYGRSLGSGLAAGLAAEMSTRRAPALTVLVSPYTSMVALAGEHYPWVPQALMRYPMRTDALIGAIRGPVLLIHGERDPLIAPRHSEALKALAAQATLLRVPGAAHNDLQEFDVYLGAFARALQAL
jgi:pimeloyl-ACP methyl ester carboxylesterase